MSLHMHGPLNSALTRMTLSRGTLDVLLSEQRDDYKRPFYSKLYIKFLLRNKKRLLDIQKIELRQS